MTDFERGMIEGYRIAIYSVDSFKDAEPDANAIIKMMKRTLAVMLHDFEKKGIKHE